MTFHEDVLKVKQALQESGDPLMAVMRMLTEPQEPAYIKEYEAMWESVLRASKSARDSLDRDAWVRCFLVMVDDGFKALPKYFSANARDRKRDIDAIRKHTKALQRIYKHLKFNNADGVQGEPQIKELQLYADSAEKEISGSILRGKRGKNDKAIAFIRGMRERHMFAYEAPLNSVLVFLHCGTRFALRILINC